MKKLFFLSSLLLSSGFLYSQNVGIGTTLPQKLLHVLSPSSYTDIAKFECSGGYGQILVSNGTIESDLGADDSKGYTGTNTDHDFTIRAGGEDVMTLNHNFKFVGIGTSQPECKLNVVSNTPYESVAVFRNNSGYGEILVSNGTKTTALSAGATLASVGSVTPVDFSIMANGLNRIYINHSTGHVGIGTNFPNQPLTVSGTQSEMARFQTSASSGMVMFGNGSAFTDIGHNGSKGWVGTNSPQDFALRTGSNDKLFVQHSTGNVGIGNNAPACKLDVSGSMRVSNDQQINGRLGINTLSSPARFQLFENTSESILGYFEAEGGQRSINITNGIHEAAIGSTEEFGFVQTSTPSDFAIRTGETPKMLIKHSNGYVGIGTLNPAKELHVEGSALVTGDYIVNGKAGIGTSTPNLPLTVKANASQDVMQFVSFDGFPIWHWWMPSGDLVLTESAVEDYRITVKKATGNIGIGKANPNAKLDVNGSAIIGGTLSVTGAVTVGSIVQPATTGVSFNANFSNYGSGYELVSYYRDKEKRVHLSGLVAINGTQAGVIFNLPADCRPQGDLIFLVMGGSGPSRIDVRANGEVSIATAVPAWISLNGISFRAN
jgi:hypothetical protein